jgi:hypothetical protein
MADVNWQTGVPSDSSLVGLGARDIRLQKKAIADWLSEDFQFPDKTNPIQESATRPIIAPESASSFGTGDSAHTLKGFFASDTSRYIVYWQGRKGPPSPGGRIRRMYMGGPNYIEDDENPGTAVHLRTSGMTELSSPDTRQRYIPFDNAAFNDNPSVFVTSSNSDYLAHVATTAPNGFWVNVQPVSGSASNVTIWWNASGITDGVI